MSKSIEISEQLFKNAAKRLKNNLPQNVENFSYNQCLQLLSQSFFCKSFEEIKSTLFEENNVFYPVIIFHYGSESILTKNGHYVYQRCIGTDNEITEEQLYSMALSAASEHNSEVKDVYLPEILGDKLETDEVIELARMMGYFTYENTIFDLLETFNIKIIINGELCHYRLDGDYVNDMINEGYETLDDLYDHIVWHPEFTDIDGHKHELYITFKELCNASTTDQKEWIVESEGIEYIIEFFS